jgi:hypothetical protein
MPTQPASLPPTHHLMRVRVRVRIFDKLKGIAKKESLLTGDHTSVSDLVRAALSDWVRVYETTEKLYELPQIIELRVSVPDPQN